MAKVFPERLPESVLNEPKRFAERKVYEALSSLGNKFTVYYSVSWQARTREGGARDGEADFIIAHPDMGLMVIEVKGGGIGFDSSTGLWFSVDRSGEKHSIKDPLEQARTSKYELVRKLGDLPGWEDRWLTHAHVVAFPDIYWGNVTQRPDLPGEIVLDAEAFSDIEGAVRNAFRYYAGAEGGSGGLGYDRMEIVESLLARSFQIKTPLGVELDYEDERLIELTEQQMIVLDLLSTRRRAAIKGCAGSGKTMLAVEKARRLASQGFEVLLTCFNYALAEDLAQRVPDGVTVNHFHGLCKMMSQQAGFSIRNVRDETEFYDQVLPDMLLESIEKLGPQFDAVIVDEGQDFRENWWLGLVSLLRDPEGLLYVFYDDNQNLYQGFDTIANVVNEAPFPLLDNCRNTQKIHHLISSFHHAGNQLRSRGPLGRPPEVCVCRGDGEQTRCLQVMLHRLVNDERVHYKDLVVLTPRSNERTCFKPGVRLGNFTLCSDIPSRPGQVQVSSVHRFKGLERKVVILVEIDQYASRNLDSVLYVGCSRARTHLIVLLDENTPEEIKSKVRQNGTL